MTQPSNKRLLTEQMAQTMITGALNAAATTTTAGIVALATSAETLTGTNTAKATTPADVKAVADTKAALAHTHAAADITSGSIGLANGGTGGTDVVSARVNLGLGTLATLNAASLTTNVTGTLPVTNGGTGATDTATARTNLGLGSVSTLSAVSLTTNVTGILPLFSGGTGAADAPTARTNIGAAAVVHTHAAADVLGGTNGQILTSDGTKGVWTTSSGGGGTIAAATTTSSGIVRLATDDETTTGTDTTIAVTPTGVAAVAATKANTVHTHSAADITAGILPLTRGGTGQSTQQAAINTLTGTQIAGRYLRSDGTNATLSVIQAADVPTLNQNTTGTAAGLSTTLGLGSGGTGQTTQQAAINALASVTTSGQYLRGNGTNVVMSAIQAGDVPTLNQSTTGSAASLTTGRTIQTNLATTTAATFNGTANVTPGVTGTLPVANGGTGATSAATALTALGAAPLDNPTFTGSPSAPTPINTDNSTNLATTAWVESVSPRMQYASAVSGGVRLGTGAVSTNGTVASALIGYGVFDWTRHLKYRIVWSANSFSAPGTSIYLQFGSSSTMDTGTFYAWAGTVNTNGTVSNLASAASDTSWRIGFGIGETTSPSMNGSFEVIRYDTNARIQGSGIFGKTKPLPGTGVWGADYFPAAPNGVSDLRLLPGTGTANIEFRVFGE